MLADRRLITIVLIVFVGMVGAAMILPILPLYAKRQYGLPEQAIPLLNTSFFAAQFVAAPILGRASDRYGRVPVLLVSQIGTVISFLLLAIAPTTGWLFFARILDGITGGNIIVAQAYITDVTPRERRTEALGYIFAVFGLGFVIGPAIGTLLATTFGVRVPYMIAALAAALVVLLTRLTLDESLGPEQRAHNRRANAAALSPRLVIRNQALMLIVIIAFIAQFGLGLLQATLALFGDDVLFAGYEQRIRDLGIGALLAVIGLTQFLTQAVLIRRLAPRLGDAPLVVIGNASRMLGLYLLAMATSPFLGAFAAVFFASGMGLMMPPLQSLSTRTVPDELRGGVLGVYQSTLSLAIIMGTALSGVLFTLNPAAPYWLGGTLSLIAILPAMLLMQRSRANRLLPSQEAQPTG